jgi:hypothetical protein
MEGIQMIPPDLVTQIAERAAGFVTFLNTFSTFRLNADGIAGKDAEHPHPGMRPNADMRFMSTNSGPIIPESAELKAQGQRRPAGFGMYAYRFNSRP